MASLFRVLCNYLAKGWTLANKTKNKKQKKKQKKKRNLNKSLL
jgi:hypothetical protein